MDFTQAIKPGNDVKQSEVMQAESYASTDHQCEIITAITKRVVASELKEHTTADVALDDAFFKLQVSYLKTKQK